jgi:hypothetical protein
MNYTIIQPPFDLNFPEMSKKDLVAYREWFHSVIPERTSELGNAVKGTAGFESWDPDLTPDSLAVLGEWFRREVETRRRSDVEMAELKSRLTFPIDVPNEELTNRTFSLAMDVGMYFGQTILKNLSGTRWDQPMKNKKFADYGQPVIMGFGTVPLNPVRIAVNLAYAFAAKEQSGDRLRALFDVWSKKRN